MSRLLVIFCAVDAPIEPGYSDCRHVLAGRSIKRQGICGNGNTVARPLRAGLAGTEQRDRA